MATQCYWQKHVLVWGGLVTSRSSALRCKHIAVQTEEYWHRQLAGRSVVFWVCWWLFCTSIYPLSQLDAMLNPQCEWKQRQWATWDARAHTSRSATPRCKQSKNSPRYHTGFPTVPLYNGPSSDEWHHGQVQQSHGRQCVLYNQLADTDRAP